ncbi:MAG: imelysin family protein [Pseudomonadota bacterium]
MLKRLVFLFFAGCASATTAQDIGALVDQHVLPGYRTLAETTGVLRDAARADCAPDAPDLRQAYHDAFDAWVQVSHLRFGPSEAEDRAFALAFWPDPRGATPKSLATLIADEDPVIDTAEAFATVSVAGRGFYALEFLLYDEGFADRGDAEYRCALIRAVASDIALNSAAILADWDTVYADLVRNAGDNDTYRTRQEAARQMFTALATGLEFTSAMRVGRPLGTFDRPHPRRAEARRSGRSLRHVVLSLEATQALTHLLSGGDEELDAGFDRAIKRARTLDDPVFAGVSDPQGRLRVEALQQNIDVIRQTIAEELGPKLGVAAGFNSLDGD